MKLHVFARNVEDSFLKNLIPKKRVPSLLRPSINKW